MFESTPHIINFKQINLHDLQLEWKAVWILISRPRRSQLIRIYTAPQQNVGFTKCILFDQLKGHVMCLCTFNIFRFDKRSIREGVCRLDNYGSLKIPFFWRVLSGVTKVLHCFDWKDTKCVSRMSGISCCRSGWERHLVKLTSISEQILDGHQNLYCFLIIDLSQKKFGAIRMHI